MTKLQINAILQITAVFIIPLVLIIFNIVPVQYRFIVLLFSVFLVLAIVTSEGQGLRNLGIRLDNLKTALWRYLLLTLVSIILIFILARLLNHPVQNILNNPHFQFIFFAVSLVQEFLFRSFLIPKLKIIFKSPVLIIILNGLLFGIMHLIYPHPLVLFILCSLLGMGFAGVYYYRPNLILATLSHAVINFLAVWCCFASFSAMCR